MPDVFLPAPVLLAQAVEVGRANDLAQPAIDLHSLGVGIFVLILVGAGLATALTIVRWSLRHAARERELEHKERLRAIECGFLLPRDHSFWSPVRVALVIGAGVPLGAFAAAASADDAPFAFPSALAIGLPALIGGTVLAYRLRGEDFPPRTPDPKAKPYLDEAEREMAEYAS